jgi:hypothetical protein
VKVEVELDVEVDGAAPGGGGLIGTGRSESQNSPYFQDAMHDSVRSGVLLLLHSILDPRCQRDGEI